MFGLVLYVGGGYFVETFVNYPSWRMIGAAEFRDYHNVLQPRIITFMVARDQLSDAFDRWHFEQFDH